MATWLHSRSCWGSLCSPDPWLVAWGIPGNAECSSSDSSSVQLLEFPRISPIHHCLCLYSEIICCWKSCWPHGIGVGAQSTLVGGGGQNIFAWKYMYEELTKCPNFTTRYLSEKYFFRNIGGKFSPCPHQLCVYYGGKNHWEIPVWDDCWSTFVEVYTLLTLIIRWLKKGKEVYSCYC